MLGKPKFDYGDKVSFEVDGETIFGEIYIIDRWGTFFDDSDVSYDIMVNDDHKHGNLSCLYKHIPERMVNKA